MPQLGDSRRGRSKHSATRRPNRGFATFLLSLDSHGSHTTTPSAATATAVHVHLYSFCQPTTRTAATHRSNRSPQATALLRRPPEMMSLYSDPVTPLCLGVWAPRGNRNYGAGHGSVSSASPLAASRRANLSVAVSRYFIPAYRSRHEHSLHTILRRHPRSHRHPPTPPNESSPLTSTETAPYHPSMAATPVRHLVGRKSRAHAASPSPA